MSIKIEPLIGQVDSLPPVGEENHKNDVQVNP